MNMHVYRYVSLVHSGSRSFLTGCCGWVGGGGGGGGGWRARGVRWRMEVVGGGGGGMEGEGGGDWRPGPEPYVTGGADSFIR